MAIRVAVDTHATSVTWSQEGHLIYVSLGNGSIAVADSRNNQLLACLKGHNRACYGTALLDSSTLLSFSSDGSLKKWDINHAVHSHAEPTMSLNLNNFSIFGCCPLLNSRAIAKHSVLIVGCSVFSPSIFEKSSPAQQWCWFLGNVHAIKTF